MTFLQILKTFAALAGILGLIFGLAYLLKRISPGGTLGDAGQPGWRIVGIKALGPKRHIYILEVGTRLLLIGTTDRTMTPLMEIQDQSERESVMAALTHKGKPMPSFRDFLKRAES